VSVHDIEVELIGAPSSVADARRFVADVLESAGALSQTWTAMQVVSELATNAVVHARTGFVVRLTYDDARIRIAVTDRKPFARAVRRRFSSETTTGRGLRLVDALGEAWGVDETDTAKTVWCDLPRGDIDGDSDVPDEVLVLLFRDSDTADLHPSERVPGQRTESQSKYGVG
jgi:anti-sigma regulatory factor (Ser/Thr protein kinase)